ncbi:nucleic acid-binding, OB-fold protein [Tanacetum coccineum]
MIASQNLCSLSRAGSSGCSISANEWIESKRADIVHVCVALDWEGWWSWSVALPRNLRRAMKCYAIVEAINFDTGFASFVLGYNPILSSMPSISSLPPLIAVYSACIPVGKGQRHIVHVKLDQGGSAVLWVGRDKKTEIEGFYYDISAFVFDLRQIGFAEYGVGEWVEVYASVDMEKISKETHGYVGADLVALCTEAALHSLLQEGAAYKISGFICIATSNFQQTLDTETTLRFRKYTKFDTIPSDVFPKHYFKFVSYNQLDSKMHRKEIKAPQKQPSLTGIHRMPMSLVLNSVIPLLKQVKCFFKSCFSNPYSP